MRKVKRMYNKAIHFIGICFGIFGIMMLMKMAGLGDWGGSCADIARYGAVGLVSISGGAFLAGWAV